MAWVEFTHHLKRHFPGLEGMEAAGETVAEVVASLEAARPGLRDWILDEYGRLRRHVNIFVGKRMVRDREGLGDEVKASDRLFVLQALSGG